MDVSYAPIATYLVEVAALVIGGFITAHIGGAVNALQLRTHILLTDQQVEAVEGAVRTGVAMVQKALDAGLVKHANLTITNQFVVDALRHVMNSVPDAIEHLDATAPTIANMILARVYPPRPTALPMAPPA